MKKIYLIPLLSAGLLMAGCSKDAPFSGEDEQMGQVLKSALDMSTVDNDIQITRADGDVDVNNFKVNFIKDNSPVAAQTYTYGEMPEVVTLPAGNYKATAEYGQNLEAEWENPWYYGESQTFEVVANEITSYIDPIVCELNNIKATVTFDSSLADVMSDDSYVEVKVGSSDTKQGLKFTKTETRAGYLQHTDETTLVATFHGVIDGSNVVETKSYEGIQKGRWYKLTFKLHQNGGGQGSGDINGDIVVDASVTVDDVNRDVEVAGDEPLDDSERPNEGGDDPEPPTPGGEAPVFEEISEGLVFEEIMHVTSESTVEFKVTSSSDAGITVFTCDIDSPFLNDDILGEAGLTTHLDLCNLNDAQVELLQTFGFPCNVGGQKEVIFKMTPLVMGMLNQGNDDVHQFKVTVSDANGSTVKTLKLQFIQ